MALGWVYQNTGSFGGDATRMTLFSQSTGGSSTDIHSYTWFDDPLVSAFII